MAVKNNLVFSPHPLLVNKERQLHSMGYRPGETLDIFLRRSPIDTSRPLRVMLDDRVIHRDDWASTLVGPDTLVNIRTMVQGGDGSNPAQTLLTIAVLVLSQNPAAASAVGGAVGAGSAVGSALITVGGMYLTSQLYKPPKSVTEVDQSSPTYNLQGGRNATRLHAPLQLLIGTHRMWPDNGAKPFTSQRGIDQYLHQVFNFGLSDLVLSDFKIGDTPLSSFDDTELQESDGTGALDLFPGNVDSLPGSQLTFGDWVQLTSSIDTRRLVVDINGLVFYTGKKGIEQLRVTIDMEFRASPSGAWAAFPGGPFVIDHGSRNRLVFSPLLPVALGQYDVRCRFTALSRRKVSIVRTGTVQEGDLVVTQVETFPAVSIDDVRVTAQLNWVQLKSYQPDNTDYSAQKRVGLEIRATSQLNGVLDAFNAIGTGECEAWTGAAWVKQANSNPAWWFRWLAKGKTDANGLRLFGAGYSDLQIDEANMQAWGAWCDSKGLAVNLVFDQPLNCFDMLSIIARAGRASLSWGSGKLGVVYDEANLPPVGVFGMANIRHDSFKVEYLTARGPDEIVLNWINPALGYQLDTVRQALPGVVNPVNPVTVDIPGITDEAQAGREVNLMAAEQEFRVRQLSWATDLEGLAVSRGNVVTLSHDVTQWGYSGRLISGTTTDLLLDREVPFDAGPDYWIGVREPNGNYNVYRVAVQTGNQDSITLLDPLPTSPDADPDNPPIDYVWCFEPKATPGKLVKITDIKPISEHHVRVIATDEDDNYYLAENDSYTYVIPNNFSVPLPTISNLSIQISLVKVGLGFAAGFAFTWDITGDYGGAFIRAGFNDEPLRDVGRTLDRFFSLDGPETGKISVEITAFNKKGQFGPASRITGSRIYVAKELEPSDVAWITVLQNGINVVIRWPPIPDPDRDGYEIRYGPRGASNWEDATPLTEVTKGTNLTTADVAPGDWTFYIKARDTSEPPNYSVNAATTDAVIGTADNVNTILEQFSAPDWPGTLIGLLKHFDGTLVVDSTDSAAGDNFDVFDNYNDFPVSVATYEAPEMDIGFDDAARVWGEITSALAVGEVGVANPLFELDHRLEAGAYDGFETWSLGQVSLRYARGRLSVDTSVGLVYIQDMQVVIDQIEKKQSADNVTIAAGGTLITFPNPYHVAPAVSVFATGNTALFATVDQITTTDFIFHIFNVSGIDVGGIGRWESIGN